MIHDLRNGKRRRHAFTLVEILTVIAIMAILAALSAWAVFAMIGVQQRRNSENAIRVIDKLLHDRWNDVVASAKKEKPSQAVLTLAGGHNERAQVIWVKARLMEAFPMRYAEAAPPPWSPAQAYVANDVVQVQVLSGTTVVVYVYHAIQANTNKPPASFPAFWANYIPPTQAKPHAGKYRTLLAGKTAGVPGESSACLLAAIKTLASDGVSAEDQLKTFVKDTDGDGATELIDGFAKPLAFGRFVTQPANPAAVAGSKAEKFADPLDPDGTLLSSTWYATANRTQFETNFHSIGPAATNAWYVLPVIASGGRDQNMATIADNIFNFKLRGE